MHVLNGRHNSNRTHEIKKKIGYAVKGIAGSDTDRLSMLFSFNENRDEINLVLTCSKIDPRICDIIILVLQQASYYMYYNTGLPVLNSTLQYLNKAKSTECQMFIINSIGF